MVSISTIIGSAALILVIIVAVFWAMTVPQDQQPSASAITAVVTANTVQATENTIQAPTQANTLTPAPSGIIQPPAEMFPHTLVGGAMVYDEESNQAVLFGGQALWTCHYCDQTWIWDGSTWKKINTKNTPQGRTGQNIAYDSNNKTVIMYGGGSQNVNGANVLLTDT
jgi:hypothetical protein